MTDPKQQEERMKAATKKSRAGRSNRRKGKLKAKRKRQRARAEG
jgi:hypothetical protein